MIARLLTGIVALVACAWFVLGIQQAHQTAAASTVLNNANGPLPARQAATVASELSSAATLNPDRQLTILRAALALQQGDRSRSTQLLKGVVAHEPDNIAAWVALANSDHAASEVKLALANVARLDPGLAHSHR